MLTESVVGQDVLGLDVFGLDPSITHLNHGAFGCAPLVVRQAAASWQHRAERNPHRFNRVEVPDLIAASRARAAGFLGVEPERHGAGAQRLRGTLRRARFARPGPR